MPVRDWSRVDANIFYQFHTAWILHLSEAFNDGLIPDAYYTLPEQHFGRRRVADLPKPGLGETDCRSIPDPVLTTIADSLPPSSRKMLVRPPASLRLAQRTLTVRRRQDHRIVAMIEIASPTNKDRARTVSEFVDKVYDALEYGVHVLLVDVLPPGKFDPEGMHFAVWDKFDSEHEEPPPPADKPLSVASYVSLPFPEAYYEPLAVGDALPPMPLFLDPDWYVKTPLEETYQAAFRGMPAFWREALSSSLG